MEKYKITNHQIFALSTNFTIGSTIIAISASIAELAKQDAWIAALIAPIFGIIILWLNCFLVDLYPGKNFIEIIQLVFGRWIGFIIILSFIFFCLTTASAVVWYIGNFITINIMPETPSYAINSLFIVVIIIALLYGLETLARSAEVFLFVISGMIILSSTLILPNVKINNLLPILENGITPIFKGVLSLSSFTTLPFITMFSTYMSNINKTHKSKTSLILGYLWGMFLIFLSILLCILVLGNTITSKSLFPTYILAKEINFAGFFDRLEGIIASVWIITVFYRAVVYYFAAFIGISGLLGLTDYRKIVIPISLITLIYTNIVYPNVIESIQFDSTTWVPFSITFGFILPASLLIITAINKFFRLKFKKVDN
jgi:spore germination protein KB